MTNTHRSCCLRAVLLTCVLTAAPAALAIPMYYTFTGTVNWGPIDELGIIATGSNPFGPGDSISMTWEVDLDAPAQSIDLTTGVVTLSPAYGYARLVAGSMLNPADAGVFSFDGTDVNAFFNNGSALNNAHLQDERTTLDGASHFIEIRKDGGATTADYYEGATGFSVYERVIKDGLATRYQVLDTLTLSTISAVPVPAPAGIGFMLLAGICMLFVRRPLGRK